MPHAEDDDLESESIPAAMEGNDLDNRDPLESETLREMGSGVDNVTDQSPDETVRGIP